MLTAEQILAAQKASFETLFGLTNKAFEGVERLAQLNLTTSKAALADAASHTQALLNVRDAQELLALQAGLIQPLAEKTAAYNRDLYEIASGTCAEFGKAFEAECAEAQRSFAEFGKACEADAAEARKMFVVLADAAARNAPAGTEAAVAALTSAVTAANNAFESVQKTVKQAAEVAEANFHTVAASAANATKTAATRKR